MSDTPPAKNVRPDNPDASAKDDEERVEEEMAATNDNKLDKVKTATTVEKTQGAENAAKILIIEDNPKNARLMQRVLQRFEYQLFHAEDGESGLQMALAEKPDLILLDLGLPDVDGQTVAGWLKRPDALPNTPIVVVTAWPSETARKMIEAYECEGYISKPINTREFHDQIKIHLKKR